MLLPSTLGSTLRSRGWPFLSYSLLIERLPGRPNGARILKMVDCTTLALSGEKNATGKGKLCCLDLIIGQDLQQQLYAVKAQPEMKFSMHKEGTVTYHPRN
jgi:hypothetical protein